MSDYKFSCYRCGQHLAFDESLSGTQIQCPVCQAPLLVPFPGYPQTGPQGPPLRKWRVKFFIDVTLALIAIASATWVLIDDRKKREEYGALANLGAVYDRMKSYQDKASITQEVQAEGRKRAYEYSASLAMQKPNLLNLQVKSEQGDVQLVCDGQKTWTYASIFENQYISRNPDPLPQMLSDLLDHSWLGLHGALDYYHIVLTGDAHKAFKRAKNLKFGGRVLFEDKPAYLLTWEFQSTPFRLSVKAWIDQANGMILKMVEDFTVVASELAKLGPYSVVNTNLLKVTTVPRAARSGEALTPEQFVFQPPVASKSVFMPCARRKAADARRPHGPRSGPRPPRHPTRALPPDPPGIRIG